MQCYASFKSHSLAGISKRAASSRKKAVKLSRLIEILSKVYSVLLQVTPYAYAPLFVQDFLDNFHNTTNKSNELQQIRLADKKVHFISNCKSKLERLTCGAGLSFHPFLYTSDLALQFHTLHFLKIYQFFTPFVVQNFVHIYPALQH